MFQVLGNLDQVDLGRDLDYYRQRGIFLDCRGSLTIHKSARVGFGVKIITQSHDLATMKSSWDIVNRPVFIGANAFVGSFSILYNCTIGESSVVVIGSVVRSVDIPPGVMVAGNPARIIATRSLDGEWCYLPAPVDLPKRKQE